MDNEIKYAGECDCEAEGLIEPGEECECDVALPTRPASRSKMGIEIIHAGHREARSSCNFCPHPAKAKYQLAGGGASIRICQACMDLIKNFRRLP